MFRRLVTHAKAAFLVMAICLVGGGLWARQCQAETYAIDTTRTQVRFTYQFGLVSQSAQFSQVSGTVNFDEKVPQHSRVDAVIKTASLKASESFVEDELKGSSFFNVAAQPEIRFKSKTVNATAKNSAELTGELTMNGVTQPVTLQVLFYGKGASLPKQDENSPTAAGPAFTATTRIKRSAFNMTAYELLVADEIEIRIDAPLRKK